LRVNRYVAAKSTVSSLPVEINKPLRPDVGELPDGLRDFPPADQRRGAVEALRRQYKMTMEVMLDDQKVHRHRRSGA
jgi:hypothetical protein